MIASRRRQLAAHVVFCMLIGIDGWSDAGASGPKDRVAGRADRLWEVAPEFEIAGNAAVMSVQDPPVIPRALLKRQSNRPQRFVRTELFFGTAAPADDVTEEEFLAFLDAEVSSRFPEGLTLFKGHGRFTGENGVLIKEDPFVVILLHPFEHFRANDRKIEDIRRLYKIRFRQESVLRVDYQFSVRVSF
jgi:Protein of unknown function (DUF3574)